MGIVPLFGRAIYYNIGLISRHYIADQKRLVIAKLNIFGLDGFLGSHLAKNQLPRTAGR